MLSASCSRQLQPHHAQCTIRPRTSFSLSLSAVAVWADRETESPPSSGPPTLRISARHGQRASSL
eukprot:6869202-Prymnesium_polylepis.1